MMRERACRGPGEGAHERWVERDRAVVWHGFTQMSAFAENAPIIVEAAEGRDLIDVEGNTYFDAISSLWVNTLGHGVPELDAALVEQLGRVAHSTMLGNGSRVVVELAEELARVAPVAGAHVMFASDGACAVEQAIKMAFQYWANRGQTHRTRFLAFGGAYHGDTIGAMSVGDGGFGADLFTPLRFPVLRAPSFDDPRCFETAAAMVREHAAELAAVIVEPLVQAAAGMRMGPPSGFRRLGQACREADVLLVCDEVATGFGRTGTLFASEQCDLAPDLLCLGKSMTGGYLPMSATVASGAVFDGFLGPDLGTRTLYHGHSYGGNALAAAVALRHLRLLEERQVLANVLARSLQLRQLLAAHIMPLEAVRSVRLCGLMGGVDLLPAPRLHWGRRVSAACVRRGVLVRPIGETVTLMPPLTVTAGELERLVTVLGEAIREVTHPTGR
jgi:adenosylmethionine-8-amino-7-oxononanoate aminotransferase